MNFKQASKKLVAMILILGCFKLQDEVIWKHKDCALEPVSVLHYLSPSVHADIYRMFWGRRSEVMQRFTVLSYIMQSGWAFIDYFDNLHIQMSSDSLKTKYQFWCWCKWRPFPTNTLQQISALHFAVYSGSFWIWQNGNIYINISNFKIHFEHHWGLFLLSYF